MMINLHAMTPKNILIESLLLAKLHILLYVGGWQQRKHQLASTSTQNPTQILSFSFELMHVHDNELYKLWYLNPAVLHISWWKLSATCDRSMWDERKNKKSNVWLTFKFLPLLLLYVNCSNFCLSPIGLQQRRQRQRLHAKVNIYWQDRESAPRARPPPDRVSPPERE